MKIYLLGFTAFLIFLMVGLVTNSHYGISWDEPTHFRRGLAYDRFFLTGKLNYDGLAEYNLEKARADKNYHERSFYKDDLFDLNYYLSNDRDWGHPPLNGIMAGFFNLVFYEKLGLVDDIQSFHIFNIFVSALLVGTVFLFSAETFGVWAGIFSAIFLATYPLFFAESHFNIKDPAETAFFTLTLYLLWKGFKDSKQLFIIFSAICAGIALSTKFNILFVAIIIISWSIVSYFSYRTNILKEFITKKRVASLLIFPIIMFGIFFASWPYLWQNTTERTASIFRYYKEVGTETHFQPDFIIGIFNTYPIQWILYTTLPIVLIFFLLGIATIKFWTKEQKLVLTLWILWFIVTVGRVSFSKLSIYGGVRQIMEYIPAMALIAGAGSEYFRLKFLNLLSKYNLKIKENIVNIGLLVLAFFVTTLILVRLHPNENVYFNFLIGGLQGAKEKNIPAAGNSFGNAYWQGTKWLNQNSEKDARLALIQGSLQNVPTYQLRGDIQYSNNNRSGIDRGGEYLMDLTYNYETKAYFYNWEYVEKFLEPVFEVKVDNVAILKIWKNDLAHTKPEYRMEEKNYRGQMETKINGNEITVNLPKDLTLSRMILRFTPKENCEPFNSSYVYTSTNNDNWLRESDPISSNQLIVRKWGGENNFTYFFAARSAKYIRILADSENSCILNQPKTNLVIF